MYDYETEKPKLFTDDGQRKFLKIRDNVNRFLSEAGAFSMGKAMVGIGGDSWLMMACVDRLVELCEIREVGRGANCPGQHRIFVKNGE